MIQSQITREYEIPLVGWAAIIYAPRAQVGPYYARVADRIAVKNGESEDDTRVKLGKNIEMLMEAKKTELESKTDEGSKTKLKTISTIIECIRSSQTPLVALDSYLVRA